MPRNTTYQPPLSRFLIKALHHEARLRKEPMTRLLARIVSDALEHSEGMRKARAEMAESAPARIAA
ncbi:hypothetical protein [Haloferula sp. A504]|uniref:hypothetical protein n=1 Tax=Haloferula sp. A504 TaxID=3373601 RepID=UPI0031BEA501|nr:hypothetical protein [Verrucomicrobiaceae bacterium E54]